MIEQENRKRSQLLLPALVGAALGLTAILAFVLPVDAPHPDWPRGWAVRPLIITPLAGAVGGVVFHYFMLLHRRGSLPLWLAMVAGVVVFLVGLWMGIVLGLDGTLWD